MSLTLGIQIVNGDDPEKYYSATFTAAERGYISKAVLKMPQHIGIKQEFEITVSVMRKLGYLQGEGKELAGGAGE
ncbi:hypothetical protein LCGC14_0997020 [marine sediment metagenome]|uniref:Uncharacterized protein n=1 Tax=marine sediment metagenome TaxID=412755 RepID=A0A0F9RAC5_9ZZZZ